MNCIRKLSFLITIMYCFTLLSAPNSKVWNINSQVLLIKTDSSGNEIWRRHYGKNEWLHYEEGESVEKTRDDGYIIAGKYEYLPFCEEQAYLIKIDSLGNKEWDKYFWWGECINAGAFSVIQDSNDYYVVTGRKMGMTGVDTCCIGLCKLDSATTIWTKEFGGYPWGADAGKSVQQALDGGYILAGLTSAFGSGGSDVYLIKTDSGGNEEWSKTFGGSLDDAGNSVQLTTDGGYIIGGSTESFGSGGSDVYLIKTDSGGNEEWSKIFGDSLDDAGNSVLQTSDSGYIIAGYKKLLCGGDSLPKGYLIKTDSGGNEKWSKTFGGPTDACIANSIKKISNGDFIIVGAIEYYCGIGEEELPDTFILYNTGTEIFLNKITVKYELKANSQIEIIIFDVLGNRVRRLERGIKPAGIHEIVWDGRDDRREKIGSGIYFFEIKAGRKRIVKKLSLIR
ncbi:hypothetical protein KAW18_12130 [candidate division WOR-3 bacterium]|nr:hypothetical protein [candidate division WOR-3 bacterium]